MRSPIHPEPKKLDLRKNVVAKTWLYGCVLVNKFSPQSLQEREGCQKKLRVDYYCEQWEGGSERYELWEAEGTRHEHSFEISKGPKYSLIQAVNEHFKSGGSPYSCRQFVARKLGLDNSGMLTAKERDQIKAQLRKCHRDEFGSSSARSQLYMHAICMHAISIVDLDCLMIFQVVLQFIIRGVPG